jgi:hypothetical protein
MIVSRVDTPALLLTEAPGLAATILCANARGSLAWICTAKGCLAFDPDQYL